MKEDKQKHTQPASSDCFRYFFPLVELALLFAWYIHLFVRIVYLWSNMYRGADNKMYANATEITTIIVLIAH